jgi:hypothetical protein
MLETELVRDIVPTGRVLAGRLVEVYPKSHSLEECTLALFATEKTLSGTVGSERNTRRDTNETHP